MCRLIKSFLYLKRRKTAKILRLSRLKRGKRRKLGKILRLGYKNLLKHIYGDPESSSG